MNIYYIDLENTGSIILEYFEEFGEPGNDYCIVSNRMDYNVSFAYENVSGYDKLPNQADFLLISSLTKNIVTDKNPRTHIICTKDVALSTAFGHICKTFSASHSIFDFRMLDWKINRFCEVQTMIISILKSSPMNRSELKERIQSSASINISDSAIQSATDSLIAKRIVYKSKVGKKGSLDLVPWRAEHAV